MLKDKVAVITGSARGLGKEIALMYAKNKVSGFKRRSGLAPKGHIMRCVLRIRGS